MKMKALALSVGVLLSANVFAAQDSVVVATPSTVQTLNPHNATVTLDMSIASAIYDGLFKFNSDMKVQPNLATGFTVSEDGKTYTITLREGVLFTDGTPFNAAAVKYNFEDEISKKQRRASLLSNVAEFEVVSDTVLNVHLKTSDNTFINNITHPSQGMISPTAMKKYGDDIKKNPVGTGRFMLKEWIRGSKISMVVNKNYWGDNANVEKLEFRVVPEAGSRLAMLKSGQAQVMIDLPTTMKPAVVHDKKLQLEAVPSIIARYYAPNNQNEILSNHKVRQALNFAINKDAYIKVVYGGNAAELNSIIPEKIETYEAQKPYAYNVQKAKELLAEAGYPNGFKLSIWSKNNTTSSRSSEFIQQQLKAVGIEADIVQRDVASHYSAGDTINLENTPPVLFEAGWSSSSATVDWAIRPLYATTGSSNYGYYSNEKIDQMLVEGQKILDPIKKANLYHEVQEIVWDDAAAVWTSTDVKLNAKSAKVSGVDLLPDGSLSIGQVSYQ
ncbi:ABC transporter substrate-binding protein [Vibrio sp. SS-MA-C1-2]|uniref:ABC transporter substrate-binding protein n=1 Tax=Vibrio sp. SS-MA-C1-2 TaxID=2908646 RepID=UPI001F45C265|nr:ABC transporter substrate-binding protein [Vibrio sp. SS-MA-C1-2]UJF18457.1 ABC transporter substrate-binding protein [Vibrio sp. SS-MA-C1-2]